MSRQFTTTEKDLSDGDVMAIDLLIDVGVLREIVDEQGPEPDPEAEISSEQEWTDEMRSVIAGGFKNPVMVGEFVLISEITNAVEGTNDLLIAHTTDMSLWKEVGMLQSRLNDIANGQFVLRAAEEES